MLADFVRETAVFGITLSPEQVSQFATYQSLLLDWNQRMNLTAIREPRQIQQRHFLDALTCSLATGVLNGRSASSTCNAKAWSKKHVSWKPLLPNWA